MPSFLVHEVNIVSIHLHDDQKPTIENWCNFIAKTFLTLQAHFSHHNPYIHQILKHSKKKF